MPGARLDPLAPPVVRSPAASPPTIAPRTLRTESIAPAPLVDEAAAFERTRSAASSAAVAAVAHVSPSVALLAEPLPERRLPPLREALADDAVAPLSPSTLPVPADVVDVIASARRILVVGHVPPDADCAGSALGLARALTALGKEAVPCVDAELAGDLRGFDDRGDVRRAAELEGPFDLVVYVDVADRARIGAAKDFVAGASAVAVVDHHQVTATPEELGVRPDQRLARWVVPEADAAGLLVAAVVDRLEKKLGALPSAERKRVHEPLAAGAYQDTGGFTMPGASVDGLRMFKHLMNVECNGDLAGLEEKLLWSLPADAERILDGVSVKNGGRTATVALDRATQDRVLDSARVVDGRTNRDDVRGALMERLDALSKKVPLAVALFEVTGGVLLSTRSQEPGPALSLAQALGGGGHLRKAGGLVKGSVVDVRSRVDAWLTQWELQSDPRVRFQR